MWGKRAVLRQPPIAQHCDVRNLPGLVFWTKSITNGDAGLGAHLVRVRRGRRMSLGALHAIGRVRQQFQTLLRYFSTAVEAFHGLFPSSEARRWPALRQANLMRPVFHFMGLTLRVGCHFVGRGLFAHKIAGPSGKIMPALPVPIDPQFRSSPRVTPAGPKLGGGKA